MRSTARAIAAMLIGAGASVAIAPETAHASPIPVNVVIDDSGAVESSGSIVFTVRVQQGGVDVPAQGDVNFTYATSNGTASAPGDYAQSGGSAKILSGQSTTTVNVPIASDALDENDETFTVAVDSTDPLVTADDTATGTITDDDASPTVSIGNATVTEGNAGAVTASFPVTLSTASGRAVSVSYSTSNGTAASPGDYATKTSSVTFDPGETSETATVEVAGDTLDEDNETFTVTLSSPVNASLGTASATGTVTDDDGLPSVSIGNATAVTEGNSGTVSPSFPITLSPVSGRSVTVTYTTANGTAAAPGDYTSKSASVTFAAGETSKTATIEVAGDTLDEDNETFTVTLSSPVNASLGTTNATGTITDDDALPAVSIGGATAVTEGNSGPVTASFPITLSPVSGRSVTVTYTTANGTAAAPGDYTSKTSSVTFAAGETSKTATVEIAGDTLDEDNETFIVTLSSLVNASLGTASATGTITDDDALPVLDVDDWDAIAFEDEGTVEFTVLLSGTTARTVTVDYVTNNESALAPGDYVSTSGTLTFAPGETSKTVAVSLVDDTAEEDAEHFEFGLLDAVNATLGSFEGSAQVLDDDVPDVDVLDASQTEGSDGFQSISTSIVLSHASTRTVTATFSTQSGSAGVFDDYSPLSGTVTLAPGVGSVPLSVDLVTDRTFEATETFSIAITSVTNAYIADGRGVMTIVNDDPAPFVCCPSSLPPFGGNLPPRLAKPSSSPPPPPTPALVLDAVGGVHAFGSAQYLGSLPERGVPSNVIDVAIAPNGAYYVLDAVGGVHVFGPGEFYGSLPGRGIPTRVVAIDVAPDGTYYVLDAVGGVHAFGPGPFYGSLPGRGIPTRVIDLSVGDDGTYYVLDAVGGVHVFGPGEFHGSLPGRNIPADVAAIDAGPNGGYLVLDAVGGVHVFGPGAFHGSLPGRRIPTKGVDIAASNDGSYIVLDHLGQVHQFGRMAIYGSLGQRGIRAGPIALASR